MTKATQVHKNRLNNKGTDLVLSDSCLLGFLGRNVQASVTEKAGRPVMKHRNHISTIFFLVDYIQKKIQAAGA